MAKRPLFDPQRSRKNLAGQHRLGVGAGIGVRERATATRGLANTRLKELRARTAGTTTEATRTASTTAAARTSGS